MKNMILDDFQKKAIEHVEAGFSVLVSAPTGAGKTVIAERVIEECMAKDSHVIYTAPIKALSNQKYREFSTKFPDKVGILTGDVSINPHSPILIMTTEIFRNKLLSDPDEVLKYAWVIFDEIHYLDDIERGTVWEECIIFLPKHMKMLGLSATVPNIDQLAKWIESIHKHTIKIVKENNRPVPLHFFYQCNNDIYKDLKEIKPFFRKAQNLPFRRKYRYRHNVIHIEKRFLSPNRLSRLISHLCQHNALPCMYFSFGRRRVEELAFELIGHKFLTKDEAKNVTLQYDSLLKRFDLAGENSAWEMYELVKNGIAFHHAGMLPTLKEVVERLFTSRLIKIIFTTETFALGINMPARSVVFDELRKFYGTHHDILRTRDFYQMAGRAGRRGIDKYGLVFSRINPHWINLDQIRKIVYSQTENVISQWNNSYGTLLHLYDKYADKLFDIYPKTLHWFQSRLHERNEALGLFRRKVELLKHLKYIQNLRLTEKGEFASNLFGYELAMGELYQLGIFEDLDEVQLNVLISALVYEPRKNQSLPPIPKSIKKLKEMLFEITNSIRYEERKFRVRPLLKKPALHISQAIASFTYGDSFKDCHKKSDVDEGELVRYFRMVIQVLRELYGTPSISPSLKNKVRRAISAINRDVVDAEKQLRV